MSLRFRHGLGLLMACLLGGAAVGCERPAPDQFSPAPATPVADPVTAAAATPTLAPTGSAAAVVSTATPTGTPRAAPVATGAPPTPTPFFRGTPSPACGQALPLVAPAADPVRQLTPDGTAVAALRDRIPEAALPALLQLLAAPADVGLAAYEVANPEGGAYLNAGVPLPLASVVKVVHLVAYAKAVAEGRLDPLESIPLTDLERYWLPGLDLGSHRRAIDFLAAEGRLFGDPPHVLLEAVPTMMIRFSSNAATDYLHTRLGQQQLEETAMSLGLDTQTAPCPFLGQFLAMANVTRDQGRDEAAIRAYLADPTGYGAEATLLVDAFSSSEAFRAEQLAWRQETRRPSLATQRLFTENLSPRAGAGDYADLMARIALNGLGDPESSYLARRYLEWPLVFPANQALFANVGYKDGALPGVLTTAYYAYRQGSVSPVVVVLFFRQLPQRTYREWRRTLPHDELARWLLADPEAIAVLRAILPLE